MKTKRKLRWLTMIVLMLLMMFASSVQAAAFKKTAPKVTVKTLVNKVTLSWPKRSDLTGYEIYRADAEGTELKLLGRTKKNSYTIKKLSKGEIYYFVVRGYKGKISKRQYTNYKKKKAVLPEYLQTSTIRNMLNVALGPVGSTVYIWGGGWDQSDVGANMQARTLGVSPLWKAFFKKQKKDYNYKKYLYQNTKGLDCSGYIGWVIYNTFVTENGKPGYVMAAQKMAEKFAEYGWGTYVPSSKVKKRKAGDIMSLSGGHVYMVVGTCKDGSVVLLHSSPPGVQLCGTCTPSGTADSEAVRLAEQYMKTYYPEYYQKFPNCSRGISYLRDYHQMQWDVSGNAMMKDPEGLRKKSADQVLKILFSGR